MVTATRKLWLSRETGLLWPGLQGHPGGQLSFLSEGTFFYSNPWPKSLNYSRLWTMSHRTGERAQLWIEDSNEDAPPFLRLHHWCCWMIKTRTFSVILLNSVSSQGARLALSVGYRSPAEFWAANPIFDAYFPKIRRCWQSSGPHRSRCPHYLFPFIVLHPWSPPGLGCLFRGMDFSCHAG